MPSVSFQRGIFQRPARSRTFWIYYRDAAGKRHRERIGTRAEAIEALRNRRREVTDGRYTSPRARARAKSLTFRELALESLEHKRLRIRPRSYDTDRRRLDAVLQRIGAIPAAEVTPHLLANLFLDLGRNGAVPGRSGVGLTGSTLNRYRSLVSSVFTWAIRVGRLEANPLVAVKRFRESPSRVRYLLEDEERRLREVIRRDCPAREAEFDLALYTGMRKGEQLTLKWADVDLANGTARVRGKSGVRPVHLNESAKRALGQLEHQAGTRGTFVSPDTKGGEQTDWPRWFWKCTKKAGIDNFHFHDLRHTFASRLAMAGTDLLSIARLLGHSKVTQTEKYSHLAPSHVRDAVERIAAPPVAAEKANPRVARGHAPMPTVSAEKVAQFLNVTEQRVHQLVRVGLPKEGRGQFDPVKCMLFYIRYLQKALEKKSVPTRDGGYLGEREERVRLLRADADLREMELASQRGQLVAIQDVEKEMTELVLTTKARIMAIPPRLAPELLGETSRVMIQAKLEKACKESLAYLARSRNGGANPDTRRSKDERA